ncbi:MAG TPA: hypothetical protein VFV63_09905 [Ilumatobacteraceae bacterium]|nr:hypothetical protein [Ilumatobacteraceae bacterium]
MSVYGYDPTRVEALNQRTREAIGALDALRSDDPAAADAMHAVARMRDTLERGWIPFIEAIRTSTAMTAWRHALGADPSNHAFASGARGPSPVATWITTNGLDHLTDAEVIDRLHGSIERLRVAAAGSDGFERAERRVTTLAKEAVRRSRDDRAGFAAAMGTRLDEGGAVAILGAIDALATAARDPRRRGVPPASLDLTELLGPLSVAEPVAESIGWHLRSRTSLAPLIAARSWAWDPEVLVGLTAGLIGTIVERDYSLLGIAPNELAGNVGALATALAYHPAASLALLGDDLVLGFLATSPYLDDTSVEEIFTAGLLVAPRAGDAAMGDGLDVLSRLVAITDDDRLNDGTKRGLAASMLTFLPLLAPLLDVRQPILVPYGTGSDHTVRIGQYCDLQRLIGQLLTDDIAQLALGATTETYRAEQTERLAGAIAARPGVDAGEHRARVAAALEDVSDFSALVLRSRPAQTSLAAYEHGVLVGLAKSVIKWAARIGSIAVPSSSTAVLTAIPIASEVLTAALDSTDSAELGNLGIEAASAIGFTVAIIGLPTRAPRIRASLGLGLVPAATWRQLADLLEELRDTDDEERRLEIHAQIVTIAANDPDLDLYVTQLETLGGDAANSGPQQPASCA